MENRVSVREQMRLQIARKDLFERAKSYAYDYLDNINDRNVSPTEDAIRCLSIFDEPLPETPCNPADILRTLHVYGSPATVAQTGGRYFGFVNGSIVPAALAAKWLSDVWDQNAALYVMSPVASHLETVCENWVRDLLRLPKETVAGFVSGSSMATMCGLAAARGEILKRMGWDVDAKGMFGAPTIRVVLGEQAHTTVFKALALLGLGKDRVERVAVDVQGRIDPGRLPKLDDTTLLIIQAGNVNSGAFDPIDKICHEARRAGAWVHVDGAFGLWAAASRNKQHLTRGMEKADSWSVDAHKTLNAPYDGGIILCRHREALVSALQLTGSYIQYSEVRDGMLYTPEMSRRARAVELWATLKALGRKGVEELVDGLCDRAVQFTELLHSQGFHILNDVVFNQVLISCDTPEQTQATLAYIQKSGQCWCGGAVWDGKPVIRISVCSWVTTSKDIEHSVGVFVKGRDMARSLFRDQ